jgi:hypothetical protein
MRYHIYSPRHCVGMRCRGAISAAADFRARAGDFFALVVRRRPAVMLSGYLMLGCSALAERETAGVPGLLCTSGHLIPGCSHFALGVQCTSRAGKAGVKVSCGLYDSDNVPQCMFSCITVCPGIRNLLNSTVGRLNTPSAK